MFSQGEAYLTCFSCLFPINTSFRRQVCHSQARPLFFPCSNSVNHPIAVEEGGWNCFHIFSETMQVIDDEGPWQAVQLIPGLAFIPNEDVVYWCTLLWNNFMGCMMILSISFKPFIKSIPRTLLHHNINLWVGIISLPVWTLLCTENGRKRATSVL